MAGGKTVQARGDGGGGGVPDEGGSSVDAALPIDLQKGKGAPMILLAVLTIWF